MPLIRTYRGHEIIETLEPNIQNPREDKENLFDFIGVGDSEYDKPDNKDTYDGSNDLVTTIFNFYNGDEYKLDDSRLALFWIKDNLFFLPVCKKTEYDMVEYSLLSPDSYKCQPMGALCRKITDIPTDCDIEEHKKYLRKRAELELKYYSDYASKLVSHLVVKRKNVVIEEHSHVYDFFVNDTIKFIYNRIDNRIDKARDEFLENETK